MILAVTDHDSPTSSNATVCAALYNQALPQLLGANVAGSALIQLVDLHPQMPTIFVGHGRPEACIGSDGQPVLSTSTVACLADRTTFALACHTAAKLGRSVADVGGIWLGFVGAVSCLLDDPDLIEYFQTIPLFIRDELANVADEPTADSFIAAFVSVCDAIEGNLYDAEILAMDAHVALRWYRERIRAWLPAADEPRRPTKFSEPAIL